MPVTCSEPCYATSEKGPITNSYSGTPLRFTKYLHQQIASINTLNIQRHLTNNLGTTLVIQSYI
jgi:hypothetical protein